jgi:hypothetical protein
MRAINYMLVTAIFAFPACNAMTQDSVRIKQRADSLEVENRSLRKENDSLIAIINHQNKEQSLNKPKAEENKELLINNKLQISRIKTGYIASVYENLFLPAITLEFKNVSQNDFNESIKLDVYFIDQNSGEQMSKAYNFFTDKHSIIMVGMTKQVTLQSSIGWSAIKDQKVQARLYINDKFYKAYKITNSEYFGRL